MAVVEYGDMFEGFYLTLEEVLANLITLLKSPGWKTCYNDNRRKRFSKLRDLASRVGWGYGDFVGDRVAELEEYFGKRQN